MQSKQGYTNARHKGIRRQDRYDHSLLTSSMAEVVVIFAPQPLYRPEKWLRCPLNKKLGGPQGPFEHSWLTNRLPLPVMSTRDPTLLLFRPQPTQHLHSNPAPLIHSIVNVIVMAKVFIRQPEIFVKYRAAVLKYNVHYYYNHHYHKRKFRSRWLRPLIYRRGN